MSIAAKANQVCKSIKKPMSIPSKTRKDQKTHEHSSNPCEKVKKNMSIATKTKRDSDRRSRNTSYRSGCQRRETLPPHTPTQLRLARSLARTTRTRNETETDFPIGGLLRRLIPLNLPYLTCPTTSDYPQISIDHLFFHLRVAYRNWKTLV